jgi:hypothetical protein
MLRRDAALVAGGPEIVEQDDWQEFERGRHSLSHRGLLF